MEQNPGLSDAEYIKISSQGLLVPLAEELCRETPNFSHAAEQVLKHHGVYQQDNRDTRLSRKAKGLDGAHCFMVRIKLPGGRLTAEQYLICDQLSERYESRGLRVTSRQGLQFHGVLKSQLHPLLHDLTCKAGLTTLGAAGDVVRNVVAPPVSDICIRYAPYGTTLLQLAEAINRLFLPQTTQYQSLWSSDSDSFCGEDGIALNHGSGVSPLQEPIYGDAYLPRKFKIAIASDFDNSVDVYANDVGLIAVADATGVRGYEVLVGGSLGPVPPQPADISFLARPFTFVSAEEVIPLLRVIVQLYREYGNRNKRNRARLRFLLSDWGMDLFREKVESALGHAVAPPSNIRPTGQHHYLGWSPQRQSGLNYLGIWLENGCIQDFQEGPRYKSALRKAIRYFSPEIRFTPHHNIILAGIKDADQPSVEKLLCDHGIALYDAMPPIRRWEMACPALPFCPRALNEAERVIPLAMDALIRETGGNDDVIIRMSGCPNNCSRPRTAEIGLIAKNSREYQIFAGGNREGSRINESLVKNAPLETVPQIISRLLAYWRVMRKENEHFGDWAFFIGADALRAKLMNDVPDLPESSVSSE